MKIKQLQFANESWENRQAQPGFIGENCQLVLAFGGRKLVTEKIHFEYLRANFPNASIVMNTTAGEILGNEVYDNTISVTAIQFENTITQCIELNVKDFFNSKEVGKTIMSRLQESAGLKGVFIISDGTHINGSELVEGCNELNPKEISITGGLAGDGAAFEITLVGLNHAPEEGKVVAIGFYGDHIQIGHGSLGGWDEFGPSRTITHSNKNILFEIDGKNALDLYKEYLGPYKEELPGSALLFPLSLQEPGQQISYVRTILTINEQEKSMTFAGNMPVGSKVRLMKASFDKLINASGIAAEESIKSIQNESILAILVSCVGRKLILQERSDEEVVAANEIFGEDTFTTGFYSYGEIAPKHFSNRCGLHNQTMTITTLTEVL